MKRKKGFKNIISVKIALKKQINGHEFEPKTVYLNPSAKTVINRGYYWNESSEEILKLDIWINEGSGWIIDKIEGWYINVVNYEPLSGSSYIPLPKVLTNSMKILTNLKNKDHRCFMLRHVRLINPTNSHPERINKQDKKIAANLNYSDIAFPLDINNYEKNEDIFQMQIKISFIHFRKILSSNT